MWPQNNEVFGRWLATVVGYLIVVVVALILIRFVLGSLFWLFRAFLVVVILLVLLTIYARLKSDGLTRPFEIDVYGRIAWSAAIAEPRAPAMSRSGTRRDGRDECLFLAQQRVLVHLARNQSRKCGAASITPPPTK